METARMSLDVSPARKNAAVAKSRLSVDFIVVKNFHQVHDGK